jgi:aryl-alcohol dehydrogenase-like predicted oxidoreductase
MKYYLLGKSGLRVSEICLGTMTFGEEWGWGSPKEESREVFKQYADSGGNFIDTASNYTAGTSEKYLGEFIAGDRDRFVIATKYTSNIRAGDPNAGGNQRKNLMQSLERSLKSLNTDYIDLYWIHAWDKMTPIEETMRALDDMVKLGKVLYIGVSDAPAWIVSQANTLAHLRGWTEFIGIQIEYSLIERTSERELLPMARALDIGVTAWSPLGGGVLTGKYNNTGGKQVTKGKGDTGSSNTESVSSSRLEVARRSGMAELADMMLTERNLLIAEEVLKIAKEIGRSPAQVALNWVRQQNMSQKLPNKIIPIIGARNTKHLDDNLACLDFELTDKQMQRLNEISRVELGFPHDFLASEFIQNVLYGGTYNSTHSHRK